MTDSDQDKKPSSLGPEQYTIGWICALSDELRAARAMLDREHEGLLDQPKDDDNSYVLGSIKSHNIAMPILPVYGTSAATSTVKSMKSTFPSLRFVLMVGIGGGVPCKKNDIRLGDVVVSLPDFQGGGVVQYDLGKEEEHDFRRVGIMNTPPKLLLSTVNKLRSETGVGRKISKLVEIAAKKRDESGDSEESEEWAYLGTGQDKLFKPNYPHIKEDEDCEECSENAKPENLVDRSPRKRTCPRIHYGNIGSGNSVMKEASKRDRIAEKENVICFEMEAAGLMNEFPGLVIRGISDYADSHKNWKWQSYAAVVAAAYAKTLLLNISPQAVEKQETIKEFLSEIGSRLEDVLNVVNEVDSRQLTGERQTILDWLTPVDYAPQHNDFIRRRQPGTGQWFLDSDEFQAWLEMDKQTLFCPGIPGAGKTIITATVIDNLHHKFGNDPTIGIAYIYCNFQRQDEQKAEDLLASLLKQLAHRQPLLPGSLKELYDRHLKNRTRPSFVDISGTLHLVAATYSKVFIVVDALDECQINDSRTRFLEEIFKLQTSAAANILATSRPSKDISRWFSNCPSQTISATKEDILTYLNTKISLRQSGMDDEMRNMIRRGILEAADGMFLLPQLQTDALLSKLTKGHLKKALQTLRKGMSGLDETYDQAMGRIKDQGHDHEVFAKQILTWIIHSKRPLSALELRHALAVQEDKPALDEDFLLSPELILSLCAGLVTINEESDTILLVHHTTQEYFERTKKRWFPEAELDITTTCIRYLSFDTFKSGFCGTDEKLEERLRSNPLYRYAAENWGYHAHEASTSNEVVVNDKAKIKLLSRLVTSFLESTAKVEASSQAMLVTKRHSSHSNYSQERNMTGLHLAAYFGLDEAGSALLIGGHSPDLRDGHGRTPLSYAAERGHEAVVKLLLAEDGIDINQRGSTYSLSTPLCLAAAKGHEAVVKLLLAEDSVDVNAECSDDDDDQYSSGTALCYTAAEGHDAVIKLLLAKDSVDVNAKGATGCLGYYLHQGMPLYLAAAFGYEAVVKLLLAEDTVNVNAECYAADDNGDYWGTALYLSAVIDHEAIVKLLLANDSVDVNAKGDTVYEDYYWCRGPLLHLAATQGRDALIKLLLAKDSVDINAEGSAQDFEKHYRGTALFLAAAEGHHAVVKLLLAEDSVDVNAECSTSYKNPFSSGDEDYVRPGTPLAIAAMNWHKCSTSYKNPFSPDDEDYVCQGTPLSIAARNGHEAVVKLLLAEDEVNVNAEGSTNKYYYDCTSVVPLCLAAAEGWEAVVKLLLAEDEVDVNAEGSSNDYHCIWGTPLQLAAAKGHEAVVKLLLATGKVEINAQDKDGRTPLWWAAENGNEAVVKMLLDDGAL